MSAVVIARDLLRIRLMLDAALSDRIASPESMKDPKADAQVRFDPKSWRGPSCKGRKMSQCPPEFLDQLAEALAQMAKKEDAEKKEYKGGPASRFTRRDAARARRWAIEARVGAAMPEAEPEPAHFAPPPTASTAGAPDWGDLDDAADAVDEEPEGGW